ncbi:MAG: hypothetical protein WCD39_12940 [Methyloceanibacter sp.]
MTGGENLRKRALASLRSEKRIGPHFKPETLSVDADGTATIEAEVETVAIKRGLRSSGLLPFPASVALSTGCGSGRRHR